MKPRGLVGAVAGDEGEAFLLGEHRLHFLGDPLVEIHHAVIEQRLGGRRHGVEFHGGETAVRPAWREAVSGRAAVSPTQPLAAPVMAKGFL